MDIIGSTETQLTPFSDDFAVIVLPSWQQQLICQLELRSNAI